ncbi:ubiquinone/menaquinone biosynthesis methyltransferase [Brachybacterium huguangmaarense]
MSRADLDKKPYDVAGMFDSIASRYDLMNSLMAPGQVSRWRRATVDALDLPAGSRVLDLAAGTGTSTAALIDSGLEALACDFSLGMMTEGRRRQDAVPFVGGDAQHLPFADDAFDGAVISFGLRNVQDPRRGIAEMARVVRPGGVVVVCEFSTPTNRAFREVYSRYLLRAIPAVASRVAPSPEAYDYLAESILSWPDQEELRGWFEELGLGTCQYRNMNGGIVALHRGVVRAGV